MFTRPLFYLDLCCYPVVRDRFSRLREQGFLIRVFSDYFAKDKLRALDLKVDVMVSATDAGVDRLKPEAKGLIVTASKLKTSVEECLFSGDRDNKDEECARRASVLFQRKLYTYRHSGLDPESSVFNLDFRFRGKDISQSIIKPLL